MRITFEHDAAAVSASETDTDAAPRRELSGILVPYGRRGNTSAGPVTITAGAVTYPDPDKLNRVKLLNGHDRSAPIGVLASLEDGADGIRGTFRLPDTPASIHAHAEATAGLRDGFSVELDDVTMDAGAVTAARLVAVALVAVPAFEDARLAAEHDTNTEPAGQPARDNEPEDKNMTNDPGNLEVATVEASSRAGNGITTVADFAAAVAAANAEQRPAAVSAALSNITRTAHKDTMEPAQYVGELWSGVAYQRRVVPAFTNAPLRSYKVNGWQWAVPPEVNTWAGDKTAVPSNSPTTEAVNTEAQRLAGAHDVDRKYRDFGDVAFFESYYAAMANSYAVQSDSAVLTDVITAGTALVGGSDPFGAIVKGMLHVAKYGAPNVLFIAPDIAEGIAAATVAGAPALLGSLFSSVEQLANAVNADLPSGTVVVSTKSAATVYELPGVPIRVEAVDMVNGGIDAGVFGYFATIVHQSDAVAVLTVA